MMELNRVGEIFITKEGYRIKIVEYLNNKNVTIEFEDGCIVKNKQYGDIKRGEVKNPFHPSVCNIGYLGVGKYKSGDIIYDTWVSMFHRCYDEKLHVNQPTYKNCSVDERWHNFQNFAKWMNKQNYKLDWHLDKDILIKGNKVYSPETCCFVPTSINILFIKHDKARGIYPIGVHFHKASGKFMTQIKKDNKKVYLGIFNTIEEAFYIYKVAKEKYIKEIANKYRNEISHKVYKAMYKYKVNQTD